MAKWETYRLSDLMPEEVADAAGEVSEFMGTMSDFLQVGIDLLRVVGVFIADFPPNPLVPIVQILLAEVVDILEDLRETGVNLLFMMPRTIEEVPLYQGGMSNFERILTNSLYDVGDPNRPQFGATGRMGAVILFFSVDSPAEFVRRTLDLAYFFKHSIPLAVPAPTNLSVRPADADGTPIDDLSSIFSGGDEPETLLLEWEEPILPGDVFLDLFSDNKFLVERTTTIDVEAPTRQRSANERDSGEDPSIGEPLLDHRGQPVVVWEPLDPSDPFVDFDDAVMDDDLRLNFLANGYGMVVRDPGRGTANGRYYRVRSVPRDIELVHPDEFGPGLSAPPNSYLMVRPNGDIWSESRPSNAAFGYLPDVDVSFDLPTALLNVYRMAYLLRFDELFTQNGRTLPGSNRLAPPVPDPLRVEVEIGTPPTLKRPLFPDGIPTWQDSRTRAEGWGALMGVAEDVEQITSVFTDDPFGGADELFDASFGAGSVENWRIFVDTAGVDKVDRILPDLLANEGLIGAFEASYRQIKAQIEGTLTGRYDVSFYNDAFRSRILGLLDLSEAGLDTGIPPDWRTVRFFSDLLPDVEGGLRYLERFVKSLDNALSSATDDFSAAIDGMEQRLRNLTAILDALDRILALIESLDLDVFEFGLLFVPPDPGGVPGFLARVRDADDKPAPGPEDFTGGIVLAFGGPSEAQFKAQADALKLLFGV